MGPRLMVETPCEHGMTSEHAIYESVMQAIANRGDDGIVGPVEKCPGGAREEAAVEQVVQWLREQGAVDYEAAKIPVLDTLAMSWHKFLQITHEEAMERSDFNEMAEIVTHAAIDAALSPTGQEGTE